MRSVVLMIGFLCCTLGAAAQSKNSFLKRLFADSTLVPDSVIVFPIRGKIEVQEAGFVQYRIIEYWVFDATGRQIYNATYAMVTKNGANEDKYEEIMAFSVDKEYARYMNLQGKYNLYRMPYKGKKS
jgi:hypothetical protein